MKKEDFKKYKLPEASGVYFFLDKKHTNRSLPKKENVLYVGKATSLKDRVNSYFSKDIIKTRGVRIQSMVENAKDIFYLETNSVLEAIILESKYIKEYNPFFNIKEKDDKSYSYVVFTEEKYPRVLIKRGRDLEKDESLKISEKFGPFISKAELLEVMRFIRRLFPYRDKCKLNEKRGCFNYQLGLCPGVCIGAISEKEYAKNLKNIESILNGEIKNLLKSLEKEMTIAAKVENFERAVKLRDKIDMFNSLKDIAFIKNNNNNNDLMEIERIESYDVSHISGSNRVGVMVVGTNGEVDKTQYRKFKLVEGKNDDLAGLVEVLKRRFQHTEWPNPDIILIDGGKTHLEYIYRALESILDKKVLSKIKFYSVVKDAKHKAKEVLGLSPVDNLSLKNFLIKLNEETHRFAITYHKALRNKNNFK